MFTLVLLLLRLWLMRMVQLILTAPAVAPGSAIITLL